MGNEEAPSVQDVTVTTKCSSRIVGSEADHLNYVHGLSADIIDRS